MLTLVLIIKALLEASILTVVCFLTVYIGISVTEGIQTYYNNWKKKRRYKQWEKEHEKFMQAMYDKAAQRKLRREKEELHRKEMERYPLFHWRELAKEKEKKQQRGEWVQPTPGMFVWVE